MEVIFYFDNEIANETIPRILICLFSNSFCLISVIFIDFGIFFSGNVENFFYASCFSLTVFFFISGVHVLKPLSPLYFRFCPRASSSSFITPFFKDFYCSSDSSFAGKSFNTPFSLPWQCPLIMSSSSRYILYPYV